MACFESRLAGNSLPRGEAERWSAQDVLHWGFERFGRDIAIASAFGAEGMVLIDLAARLRSGFRVFTLDTGFFFPETYALIETVERRYHIRVERCRPQLTADEQARIHGEALWSRDPDLCCGLRKVEPLKEKLKGLSAWVAAVRRQQTAARANVSKIEWDARFEIVKLNPLADWTHERVWDYIRANHVPYNPLHDRSYPSIGCTHCTRPVRAGEDDRAGRWAGFTKTECGLHAREASAGRAYDPA
jgi:phosphoadenosine phosphosulfate reductase